MFWALAMRKTKLHLTRSEKKALVLILECGATGYYGYDRGKDQIQMLARLDKLEKVKGFHFKRVPVPNSRTKRYFYDGFSGHPEYLETLGFELPFTNHIPDVGKMVSEPHNEEGCEIESHYKAYVKNDRKFFVHEQEARQEAFV